MVTYMALFTINYEPLDRGLSAIYFKPVNVCRLHTMTCAYLRVPSRKPHLGIFTECVTFQTVIAKRIVGIFYGFQNDVFLQPVHLFLIVFRIRGGN